MLSLLKCGDTFHYMKHSKFSDLKVLLTLYQSKFPHQNHYQHSLMIGHLVITGAVSEGRMFLANELPTTFHVRDHRVNSFKINMLIFDILPYEFVSH